MRHVGLPHRGSVLYDRGLITPWRHILVRIGKLVTHLIRRRSPPMAPNTSGDGSKSNPPAPPKAGGLEALPDSVLREVLGHLPPRDLAAFEAVSKACRAVGQQVWDKHAPTRLPSAVPPGGMSHRQLKFWAAV